MPVDTADLRDLAEEVLWRSYEKPPPFRTPCYAQDDRPIDRVEYDNWLQQRHTPNFQPCVQAHARHWVESYPWREAGALELVHHQAGLHRVYAQCFVRPHWIKGYGYAGDFGPDSPHWEDAQTAEAFLLAVTKLEWLVGRERYWRRRARAGSRGPES